MIVKTFLSHIKRLILSHNVSYNAVAIFDISI